MIDTLAEKRRGAWHPAGTTRGEAEQLVARFATESNGRNDKVRSLTFGAPTNTHTTAAAGPLCVAPVMSSRGTVMLWRERGE